MSGFWYYRLEELERKPNTHQLLAAQETYTGFRYRVLNIYDVPYHDFIHEGIYQNLPHKFYMDLDGKGRMTKKVYNGIIDAIIEAFADLYNLEIDAADILWFSSSNDEKLSYHIIVPRYFFVGYCVKNLVDKVARIYPYAKRYIDIGAYGSFRLLRILGKTKRSNDRVKIFHSPTNARLPDYSEDSHDFSILKASLVTYTAESVFGAQDIPQKKSFKDLSVPETQMDAVYAVLNTDVWDISPKTEDGNNILYLTRLAPGYCITCEREHERENAMIYMGYNNLHYRCFRSDTSTIIGSISHNDADVVILDANNAYNDLLFRPDDDLLSLTRITTHISETVESEEEIEEGPTQPVLPVFERFGSNHEEHMAAKRAAREYVKTSTTRGVKPNSDSSRPFRRTRNAPKPRPAQR